MAAVSLSSSLRVSVSKEIIEHFPGTMVAFLIADIQLGRPKGESKQFLADYKKRVVEKLREDGVTKETYSLLPVCRSWRRVFETFHVDVEKKCSIDQLLGRWAKEADRNAKKPDVGSFNNFVDLYNAVSVETRTPMGALDLSKVEGEITVRYGKPGEKFRPLMGRNDVEPPVYDVESQHIVYADRASVLTWLFNHKDAAHCCVPKESNHPERIILFSERVEEGCGDPELAIKTIRAHLPIFGGNCIASGTLTNQMSSLEIEIPNKS